ncbi:choice-of-anchor A domain-containing protein [Polymorphobacter fuscus]|nr:choice-of-anchor A family protein [Polymorphobacter fuscus]NJC07309.1 choice-of-anchor A domain-containing protein [Polymorphobacter fuscus]
MSSRLLGAAIVSIIAVQPAQAAIPLDYALYTLGNYNEQGGSRIGGAVAVAGDAHITSATIGANLGSDRNGTAVVAVGGTVQYDNASLSHGNVVYGAGNASGQYTQASTPNGSFVQGNALDFARTNAGLLGLSASYGSTAATGSFSSQWGSAALTGGTGVGTDVFSVTTGDLGGIYALRLIGTAGSKAIINVSGSTFGGYFSFDRGNYAVSDVTFNFVDAQSVGLNGVTLAGSILAPLANVVQQGGLIGGSVVARNYTSGGATIGGDGRFEVADYAAGAVPEPATWAMLITGFGMVGSAMRRRRTVFVVA